MSELLSRLLNYEFEIGYPHILLLPDAANRTDVCIPSLIAHYNCSFSKAKQLYDWFIGCELVSETQYNKLLTIIAFE